MITNDLIVEQQEREEHSNQKRAVLKVLISVVKMSNEVHPHSSHITIDMDIDGDGVTLIGHSVTDFIAVSRVIGLSGYASGLNEVTIY